MRKLLQEEGFIHWRRLGRLKPRLWDFRSVQTTKSKSRRAYFTYSNVKITSLNVRYFFPLVGSHLLGTFPPEKRSLYLYLRWHSPGAGWAGIAKGKPWWCFVDSWHIEVPSPGVAAFNGFAAQAKPSRLENTWASTIHSLLPFGFNPGDAKDRSYLGKGVMTTPPFIGPFCVSVGA